MPIRPLTADLFISLDGFARGERSPAYFGYLGPDLERWIADELERPQVVLMGRVTYEMFAGMSPSGDDGDPSGLTATPKLVFSNTLREATWSDARIVGGELGEAIGALKAQDGPPIRTMGSLTLVRGLLRLGLVDRLRLVVFPLILGETGREPLFADLPDLDVELAATATLDGRLVVLEYRPAT